ncbi:helix-turn-helix domain-containing protein [Morganella morganii]|nr:LysR family transcriptional regulator [Morganella morganii]MDN3814571.1 LysR family transcriptional regulator [Morganella morganii]
MKSLTITVINRSCRKRILFPGLPPLSPLHSTAVLLRADKLGITKSAAGKRISQLEAALGVSLFQRGNRRIYPDPCRGKISRPLPLCPCHSR